MLPLLARAVAWMVLTPIFLLVLPSAWLLAPGDDRLASQPVMSVAVQPPTLADSNAFPAVARSNPRLLFPPPLATEHTRVITVVLGAPVAHFSAQTVTAAAFTPTDIDPPIDEAPPPTVALPRVNIDWLNLRRGPDRAYPVATVAEFGAPLVLIGRNADCTWLQVRTDAEIEGWVVADYVTQPTHCAALPVVAVDPLVLPAPQAEVTTAPLPVAAASAVSQSEPVATSPCGAALNEHYDLLPIEGAPTDRPAAQHPDINLAVRGYTPTQAELAVIEFDAADDLAAPQLRGLFGDRRIPALAAAYQVHDWDWGCNCRAAPLAQRGASLIGVAVQPGETIYTPDSGRGIGSGYEVLVLYATEKQITLKYTREDNVVSGYTLHLADLCIEPQLLALYRAANQAGRGQLPALRAGQAVGQAAGAEVILAIRDTGDFMDPRDREDWWRE